MMISTWCVTFRGEHIVQAMNAIGFDYICLGNHDFDFPMPVIKEVFILTILY